MNGALQNTTAASNVQTMDIARRNVHGAIGTWNAKNVW
jgi:hypothetical protein